MGSHLTSHGVTNDLMKTKGIHMDKDFIFEKGIDIAILICILKVVFIGKMSFEDVGILIGLGIIWTPHAYLSKTKTVNSNSISHAEKKIASLTSSINTLALRLKEVEKLSQQTAKTQGLTQLNRKYTL